MTTDFDDELREVVGGPWIVSKRESRSNGGLPFKRIQSKIEYHPSRKHYYGSDEGLNQYSWTAPGCVHSFIHRDSSCNEATSLHFVYKDITSTQPPSPTRRNLSSQNMPSGWDEPICIGQTGQNADMDGIAVAVASESGSITDTRPAS